MQESQNNHGENFTDGSKVQSDSDIKDTIEPAEVCLERSGEQSRPFERGTERSGGICNPVGKETFSTTDGNHPTDPACKSAQGTCPDKTETGLKGEVTNCNKTGTSKTEETIQNNTKTETREEAFKHSETGTGTKKETDLNEIGTEKRKKKKSTVKPGLDLKKINISINQIQKVWLNNPSTVM